MHRNLALTSQVPMYLDGAMLYPPVFPPPEGLVVMIIAGVVAISADILLVCCVIAASPMPTAFITGTASAASMVNATTVVRIREIAF